MGIFGTLILCASTVVCENGLCRLVSDAEPTNGTRVVERTASVTLPAPDRIAQGAMSERDFLAFLDGTEPADAFAGKGLLLVFLLALLGGLALNLTPCVLPMVPVNLLVIGASPGRGLLYGLGQMTAFGALGLLAALGGVAFGTIQSSPWFNGAVAVLLVLFALALLGAFALDFTRFRKGLTGGAFVLGIVSAALAGACIAPVLASVLLLTARLYAEGTVAALALPFVVGLGLALPWPLLGAGLKVLPKPGAWMKWVNRLFAVFLLALAVHYGLVAVRGAVRAPSADRRDLTVAFFRESDLLAGARTRPLLVVCHASWCKNCTAMERLIATSPRIREALDAADVVFLDAEDPNELRTLPGFEDVRGLPAFAYYRALCDAEATVRNTTPISRGSR